MKNLLYLLIGVFAFISCDSTIKVKTGDEEQEINIKDLISKDKDGDGEEIEPVSFRTLKKQFPNRISGLSLDDSGGEKVSAWGFSYSQANATYTDGDQTVKVTIVDVGEAKSLLKMFDTSTSFEVDKETKDGYERTLEIEGHQGYAKYNETTENGNRIVVIDDRMILTIEGKNVSDKTLDKVIDKIDIGDLEDLMR